MPCPRIHRRQFPDFDNLSDTGPPDLLYTLDDDDEEPQRVTPPMDDPATGTWNLSISESDLDKLKAGYLSQGMEEKWDFKTEEADAHGRITLRVSRSWTGIEHYLLHLETGGRGPKIHSITWSQNVGDIRLTEEQAKINAVILCRCWLGCVFLEVPHLDESLMWMNPANFYTSEAYLKAVTGQAAASGTREEAVFRMTEIGFKSNIT